MHRMSKRDHFRRLQHKRYSAGTYRNPYFRAKKNPIALWMGMFGGSVVVIFGLFLFLFQADRFSIQHISTIGLSTISHTLYEQHVNAYFGKPHGWIFQQTNRFLFSQKNFEEELLLAFGFESFSMDVQKETLIISLKERSTQFIWETSGHTYIADKEGRVIREISEDELTTFLSFQHLVDRSHIPIQIGQSLLTPKEIQSIFRFHELIRSASIEFTDTEIDQLAGKWVGLNTKDGYRILFDPSGDVESQFVRLQTILKDTIQDKSKLQYIDLRFGDHVYFK